MEKTSPPTSIIHASDEGKKSSLPEDPVRTEEPSKNSEGPPDSSSNPPRPPEDPPRFSLEELDELAQRAKLTNFVAFDALIRIMTQEEDYTEEVYSKAVPVLWFKYELDQIWRKKGRKEIKIATFGNRYEIWEALLCRWSGIPIQGYKKDLEPPYLNLYKSKHPLGTYEKTMYQGDPGLYYISLEEFKGYLEIMQKIHRIRLPLPKRLFGEDVLEEKLEIPTEGRDATANPMQIKEAEKAKEAERANLFRKKGDVWEIAFETSDIFLMKDNIGLKYIHLLLGRPGDPIPAIEMAQMGRWEQNPDSAEYDGMTSDQLKAEGMREVNLDSSNKQRVDNEQARARDEKARAASEARLEEIEREMQESANDPAKVSELSEEWKMISEELSMMKSKTNPRSAVTMAIARAIKQINEHLPTLAEYLNQTIETGKTCLYHPLVEKPIDWKF